MMAKLYPGPADPLRYSVTANTIHYAQQVFRYIIPVDTRSRKGGKTAFQIVHQTIIRQGRIEDHSVI